MKTYTIIRDIIFFILLLAILGTGIFIAKMTMVTDSNVVNVNRKIPRNFNDIYRGLDYDYRDFDDDYRDFDNSHRESKDNHREIPSFNPGDQKSAENNTGAN